MTGFILIMQSPNGKRCTTTGQDMGRRVLGHVNVLTTIGAIAMGNGLLYDCIK